MQIPIRNIIQDHHFFRGLPPAHLELLAGCARAVNFQADQVLFREGEPAGALYLIETGRVALEAHEPGNGSVLVQTLDAGEVLGWSWLFPPFVWHLQARAVAVTHTIEFNGARLLVTAERDHEFGYELMKRVAQIAIQRLQATRKQLLTQRSESVLEVESPASSLRRFQPRLK